MKSLPFVGLLLLALLSGCSKSHSPQPGLVGQWKLVGAESVTPGTVIDYAAGTVMEFRSDSTYTQTTSWGMVAPGTYSTAVSNTGTASQSFLYLKDAGSNISSGFKMQLNGLRLTLTGTYAKEYFQKL